MTKDFYLNDRGLAAYFEKDWFDQVIPRERPGKMYFQFAPFNPSELYSPYHEQLVDFLALELQKAKAKPQRILEVGSSLGRTFYEVCRKIKSVETATLIEPSQNLFGGFQKIFNGDGYTSFPVLKGLGAFDEVRLDTTPIKTACGKVQFQCLNQSFQEAKNLGQFDLVICSNVIDQCKDHLELVDFLKASTAPGGTLALSCTYQWQDKYIGNAAPLISDIRELFDSSWQHLGETNTPFSLRANERHWLKFMSHVCVVQKTD